MMLTKPGLQNEWHGPLARPRLSQVQVLSWDKGATSGRHSCRHKRRTETDHAPKIALINVPGSRPQ